MEFTFLWFKSKLIFKLFAQVIPNMNKVAKFYQFLFFTLDEVGHHCC